LEDLDDPDHRQVRHVETRDRDQREDEHRGQPVEQGVSADGGGDPQGEGVAPDQDRLHREQRQAVPRSLANLGQDGLVVLEGTQLAREELLVEQPILHPQGPVQVEGCPVALELLLGEAGVQGIDLARLARRQMDDRERHDGDQHQCPGLLPEGAEDEGHHRALSSR